MVVCQVFGTPRNHPKSKPFHDHIMCFYWLLGSTWITFAASLRELLRTSRLDKKIWLRPEASRKPSLPKIQHSGSGTTKSRRKRQRITTSLRSRPQTLWALAGPGPPTRISLQVLTEIGPRFVLDPIRILGGSFNGQTL